MLPIVPTNKFQNLYLTTVTGWLGCAHGGDVGGDHPFGHNIVI